MIIVSLGEKTYSALSKKCALASKHAKVIEVRIDYLTSIEPHKLKELLSKYTCLLTLRSKKEGGEKEYTPQEREALLKQCIDLKPKYMDLEFKRDLKLLPYLKKNAPKTKVILSFHELAKMPPNLSTLVEKMKKYKPWKMKVVGFAKETIDALKMMTFVQKHRNLIGICMGEKGQLTRVIGPLYKQPITYASFSTKQTAEGQLNVDELEQIYHYSKLNSKTKLLGIIGNPLGQSPGYIVHNQVFARRKINAVYFNFELEFKHLSRALVFFKELKTFGLSVTIPFKEQIMRHLSKVDRVSKIMPSINSVLFTSKGLLGKNTDALGALKLIESKIKIKNKKALVLGAGGTAKAIATLLAHRKANVTIINRTDAKAKKLAKDIKGDWRPFEELPNLVNEDYDILVHATTAGMKSKTECIVPTRAVFPKKVVLDVVFNQTKLIKEAQKKGCYAFDGKDFWVEQAKEQLNFWFKRVGLNTTKLMKQVMP